MDDAEAEAVLLALADPLMWEDMGNACWRGRSAEGYYGAGRRPERGNYAGWYWVAYRQNNDVDQCENLFINAKAAKAACERHSATGKWE